MLDAPGAGLAAPQIGHRAARLHLERRGRGRPPGQPGPRAVRGDPGRPRGLPLAAGAHLRLQARACRSSRTASTCTATRSPIEGSELLARAIQHETDHLDGILFIDKLDTDARKAAMKEIRESDWFGARAADRPGLARTPPTASRSELMRVVFAGTPEVALPALDAVAASAHDLVGVVTRPDAPAGRGRKLVASPVAAARRGARRTGAQARAPARPRLPGRAAGAGPRLLPGRRVRRPAAAVGPRHPRARLGQPALLGAARLARRGAGPARDLGRRRGERRDHVPDRARSSTPARRSA